MSISHTILGMLSCQSLTGYELKKIMQESPFMYWSGNNNQIYKALVELHDDGYVTSEVFHQDGAPSKKVYTITKEGTEELRRWSLTIPELPEVKKEILLHLAWTSELSSPELDELLERYKQEVQGRLYIEQNKYKKGPYAPNRTPRESALWKMIYENVIDFFKQELAWIDQVRQTADLYHDANDATVRHETSINKMQKERIMDYTIVDKKSKKYVFLEADGEPIQAEQDGLELVSICVENGTNLLLIHGDRLSPDFFRLRTGIAGAILQKCAIYNIKVAVVIDENNTKGKFKEFLAESNRGRMFNTYSNVADAEKWLLKTNERTYSR